MRNAAQPACDLEAVHAGQAEVEQDHLGHVPRGELDRVRAVVRHPDGMAAHAEQLRQAVGRIAVVVDHQHAAPSLGLGGQRFSRLAGRHGGQWQAHGQFAAQPGPRAGRLRLAAVQLDDAAHQRQPDAQPALGAIDRAFALHEEIEGGGQQRGRHADAVVDHAQHRPGLPALLLGRLLALQDDAHVPAARGVLGGVVQQVHDHLREPRLVALHRQRLGRQVHLEPVLIGLDERAAGVHRLAHHFAQVQSLAAQLDLAAGDAAHVEQVLDQARQMSDLPPDDVGAPGDLGRAARDALEHAGRVRDRGDGVAQFVRQHRDELVDAAALGLELLHPPPLGEVAQDGRVAPQRAVAAAQGAQARLGPHAAAVGAQTPAGVLRMALRVRRAQQLLGAGGLALLVRIQLRERVPDDVHRTEAEHALGAGVPVRHAAVGVHREDRVTVHALDQAADVLLALAQALFVLAPLRQVAGDLRETDHLALRVPQGGDDDVGPEAGTVLAQAPAFVLQATLAPGDAQFLLGPAAVERLLRIEAREVLPDDLVRGIALDALRALVPRDHHAVGVQHEDRVVAHALNHQAKHLARAGVERTQGCSQRLGRRNDGGRGAHAGRVEQRGGAPRTSARA